MSTKKRAFRSSKFHENESRPFRQPLVCAEVDFCRSKGAPVQQLSHDFENAVMQVIVE
jgi:hypothetical protein